MDDTSKLHQHDDDDVKLCKVKCLVIYKSVVVKHVSTSSSSTYKVNKNILIIILTLLQVKYVISVPKCIATSDSSPCTTVQDWKENVLCRIQGPAGGDGTRSGGYIVDSIPLLTDSMSTVKRKLWAQNIYASMSVILNTEWVFTNPTIPLTTLSTYEKILNRVGVALYGVNWVVSPKLCGINGKGIASCGDKGSALTPSECP